MIKRMSLHFECLSCGCSKIIKQDILIDENNKKIIIKFPDKCSCGGKIFNIKEIKFQEIKITLK